MQSCRCWPRGGLVLKLSLIVLQVSMPEAKMSTERNDRSFFFCASCGQIFFFSGTNTWSWARLKFHLFHFKQQGCAKMMNLPFVGIWCTRALPSIPQFVLFEESFLLEWETTVCTYCSIEFFFLWEVFSIVTINQIWYRVFVRCIHEHH